MSAKRRKAFRIALGGLLGVLCAAFVLSAFFILRRLPRRGRKILDTQRPRDQGVQVAPDPGGLAAGKMKTVSIWILAGAVLIGIGGAAAAARPQNRARDIVPGDTPAGLIKDTCILATPRLARIPKLHGLWDPSFVSLNRQETVWVIMENAADRSLLFSRRVRRRLPGLKKTGRARQRPLTGPTRITRIASTAWVRPRRSNRKILPDPGGEWSSNGSATAGTASRAN